MGSLKQRIAEVRRQQALARMHVLKMESDLQEAQQTLWMTMGALQVLEEVAQLVGQTEKTDNGERQPDEDKSKAKDAVIPGVCATRGEGGDHAPGAGDDGEPGTDQDPDGEGGAQG